MNNIKKIIAITFALSLLQCTGQTEKGVQYPKEKIMTQDRFDINRFKDYPDAIVFGEEKKLTPTEDTLSDGTVIIYSWGNGLDNKKYYSKLIKTPVPSITEVYKEYYNNGILKEETERFIGSSMNSDQIKFGITKFYDETGRLVKTIDESVRYENIVVKPLQLFEILKKTPLFVSLTDDEKAHFKYILSLTEDKSEVTPQAVHKALKEEFILNPVDRENVKRVFLTLSKDTRKWYVTKDIYPFGLIEFEVDTKSGDVSNREYKKEWRP